MLQVALDTCFLVDLDDYGSSGKDDHIALEVTVQLMNRFRERKAELLLDAENRILDEYKRYLRNKMLGQRIFSSATNNAALSWRGDKLSNDMTRSIARKFDPSDIPFLDVCCKLGGIYVTTEEKHLREEQRALILRTCNVQIFSLEDLHNYLKG